MYEFKVEGMSCGACVKAVTRALQGVDPKAQVAVDLKTQTIDVESQSSDKLLHAAIEDAGYTVLSQVQRA